MGMGCLRNGTRWCEGDTAADCASWEQEDDADVTLFQLSSGGVGVDAVSRYRPQVRPCFCSAVESGGDECSRGAV